MKLVIAIIRDMDCDPVTQALTSQDYRVTRIASTGGLLRKGVATLLIGVDDDRVDPAIQLLRETTTQAPEGQKRATIFVVPINKHIQI